MSTLSHRWIVFALATVLVVSCSQSEPSPLTTNSPSSVTNSLSSAQPDAHAPSSVQAAKTWREAAKRLGQLAGNHGQKIKSFASVDKEKQGAAIDAAEADFDREAAQIVRGLSMDVRSDSPDIIAILPSDQSCSIKNEPIHLLTRDPSVRWKLTLTLVVKLAVPIDILDQIEVKTVGADGTVLWRDPRHLDFSSALQNVKPGDKQVVHLDVVWDVRSQSTANISYVSILVTKYKR